MKKNTAAGHLQAVSSSIHHQMQPRGQIKPALDETTKLPTSDVV